MPDESLKRRTLSSLVWKLLERGGSAVVQLVVQIVMARLLAPEQFGALAIMLVFVNVGNVVVQSGLNTALVQAPDATEEDFSTVFWMSLAISLALYAAVFVAAPAVAAFYAAPELAWPLRVLALLLVVNAYNAVQVAWVQRELLFRKVFFATAASVAVSGACGMAAAAVGMGLWALVVQQLLYQAVNCAALALQVPWKPKAAFDRRRARSLFGFGWKLLASGLLDTGYQSLSDLVIGKQFSAAQLGLVSQGKRYPQALGNTLDGAIQPVMLSAVARVQDDLPRVKRLVRRALKTSTFLIVPCMTCFALVAEPLVLVLLGEKWLGSVWFLRVYCFTYALLPIHTTNLSALNGMGRSDLFLRLEVIKKLIGVSFLLFGAFVMRDVYWLVGSYIVTGIIGTFVNAHPNKRVIGYSYGEQLRDIGPAFGLSLAAGATALPVGLAGFHALATVGLQAAVMLGAYLLLARLLRMEAMSYLTDLARDVLSNRKPGAVS